MTTTPSRYLPTIVVGVDGSESGDAALRWAASQARRREDRIDVVHAWHIPYGPIEVITGVAIALSRQSLDFEVNGTATLHDALARCKSDLADLSVTPHVVQGNAADVLIDISRQTNAVLLAVGSRGLGGFAGLVLGSTSRACATQAPCPVAIVRTILPQVSEEL